MGIPYEFEDIEIEELYFFQSVVMNDIGYLPIRHLEDKLGTSII